MTKCRTRPWAEVTRLYSGLEERYGLHVQPIRQLVQWIEKEKLNDVLYPTTSMHDLLLTDRPEFTWGEHVLRISLDFETKTLTFRYDRLSASTDFMEKTVGEADGIETLRQFISYKFGIHRPKRAAKRGQTEVAPI